MSENRMESRLSSTNYCTIQKATLNRNTLILETDVFGDPMRPKDSIIVISTSQSEKAPRSVPCKASHVTSGFGQHTWISLQFQLPNAFAESLDHNTDAAAAALLSNGSANTNQQNHSQPIVYFIYNSGWSRTRVDRIYSSGRPPVPAAEPRRNNMNQDDISRYLPGSNQVPSWDKTVPQESHSESYCSESHPNIQSQTVKMNATNLQPLANKNFQANQNHSQTQTIDNQCTISSISTDVPLHQQSQVTDDTAVTEVSDDLYFEEQARKRSKADAVLKEYQKIDNISRELFGRQHDQVLQLLTQRLMKMQHLKSLANTGGTGRNQHGKDIEFINNAISPSTDSAVFLSALPYFNCKRFSPDQLRKPVSRLMGELENDYEEISVQCGQHLLRLLKEVRQNHCFNQVADEFYQVYGVVKRLCGSVRLSRMQNSMPIICRDIREILALEFSS